MKLTGKVAIVTGGAKGIGEATAKLFIEQGAKVVVADFSDEGAQIVQALKDMGGEALFVKTDVSKEADIQHLVTETVRHFGKLDIMVANAGIGDSAPIHELGLDRWQKMIDINLTGVFLSDKYAIEQMLQQDTGGVVVNMASMLGHIGQVNGTAYTAAKAGVVNLTRTLGVTYAKQGIRVNAVCPGYIDTPLISQASEETRNKLIAGHPIGRLGRADEIAKAILFLSSDDSSFMVGASLLVDGGYTAQ
ncbi:SDR family oxidoreductase [Paenibacillus sp. SC116]|uniref:SDR family NAD(P)-dependent oxidoreductase n=1 Tax=Paenibacillus sp. SC116 TaxID=2968986 RepID=UPI00215A95DC|nr:glucose 1-dehydrogenase [Paenibacillus sp. SC116]MCR8844534.1 SDR family oxidoreductase [Paenibacillus sp. SC116]